MKSAQEHTLLHLPMSLIDVPASLQSVEPTAAEIRAYRRDLEHPTASPKIARVPIKVRQLDTGRYELVRGLKRLKTAREARAATIPAMA